MGVLTMTEYINREAIRDALYDVDAITMEGVKILNQFPPSDVEPVRHAHWEYWDGWMSNHDMRLECACSACGYKAVVRGYGYDNIKHLPERCHGCWAKMDEEVSE